MASEMKRAERVVYCKHCGRICIKLVSNTKENPGRLFFACPIPRFEGGHGWMDWVDRYGITKVHQPGLECSCGSLESRLLKSKDEEIVQLQIENEQLSEELNKQKMKIKCLTKCFKGFCFVVLLVICFSLFTSNEEQSLALPKTDF